MNIIYVHTFKKQFFLTENVIIFNTKLGTVCAVRYLNKPTGSGGNCRLSINSRLR
jgi:hypothetical protein